MVTVAMIPVVGLWLVMSRLTRSRWAIAALLAGIAAVLIALGHLVPRASLELSLAAPVAGAAAVIGGRLAERRRLGPAKGARASVPSYVIGIWIVVSSCVVLATGVPAAFFPAADRVLPAACGPRPARKTTRTATPSPAPGRSPWWARAAPATSSRPS